MEEIKRVKGGGEKSERKRRGIRVKGMETEREIQGKDEGGMGAKEWLLTMVRV